MFNFEALYVLFANDAANFLEKLTKNLHWHRTGKVCTVTGWGRTSFGGSSPKKLLQVKVPLTSHQECENSYPGRIGSTEICEGYPQGGKDSCQGDSGGELIDANQNTNLKLLTSKWDCTLSPSREQVYTYVVLETKGTERL